MEEHKASQDKESPRKSERDDVSEDQDTPTGEDAEEEAPADRGPSRPRMPLGDDFESPKKKPGRPAEEEDEASEELEETEDDPDSGGFRMAEDDDFWFRGGSEPEDSSPEDRPRN